MRLSRESCQRSSLLSEVCGEQEFMKAMMCFMVEFWDVDRQPQPPIQPHSEPYIDFEWPLQGWCIQLPQVRPHMPACAVASNPQTPFLLSNSSKCTWNGCCRGWCIQLHLVWPHMPVNWLCESR